MFETTWAGDPGVGPEEPASGFSLSGLFRDVSPYLNTFTAAFVRNTTDRLLGNKRNIPQDLNDAGGGPTSLPVFKYPGGLQNTNGAGGIFGFSPWTLALWGVAIVGLVFAVRR